MNERKAASGGFGRAVLAALLLAAAPMRAAAMLVTVISPSARASEPFSALPEISAAEPAAGAGLCEKSAQTVDALEGAVVEARAQYWAYLMKQPDFAKSRSGMPGAEIANPDTRAYFYSRLRFWLRQDSTPQLAPETLEKLNDVSQKIRLMTDLCG